MNCVVPLEFAHFQSLSFQGEDFLNYVRLEDLWCPSGAVFLAQKKDPEGAIVYQRGNWYHSLYNSHESLSRVIAHLPQGGDVRFAALPEKQWNLARERWPNLHFNENLVIEYKAEVEVPLDIGALRPLREGDVDFLMEHQLYLDEYGGKDYLLHRIEKGVTSGIEIEGDLVGWELLQDDGTLGFLRILESFRGKGAGRSLHYDLARKVQGLGKRAISHVSIYNRRVVKIVEAGWGEVQGKVAWVRNRSPEQVAWLERGNL